MKKTARLITIAIMTILLVAAAAVATFASTTMQVDEGKTFGFSTTIKGEITSSNSNVAEVENKKIYAKNAGKATIKADANGDGNKELVVVVIVNEVKPTVQNTNAAYTQLNNYRIKNINKIATKKATQKYKKAVKKAKKIKNKAKRTKAINKAKAAYNNSITLKRDAYLESIALQRAKEMAETGKFSHTRPNGQSGLTLIKSGTAKGENIAMGQKTCEQVSSAWYASPGHRANMLRSNFKKVGIAGYTYKGVTYWAQVFSN